VGEACDELADVTAERFQFCGALSSEGSYDFKSGYVSSCCARQGTCQLLVRDGAAVGRCADAWRSIECDAIRRYASDPENVSAPNPAVCMGVAAPE
jgi:hypothetical protein